MEQKPIIFEDLDPPKRLLMGPAGRRLPERLRCA